MVTVEIDIERPLDIVFGYLTQVENAPQWYSAVEHADKTTPGPISIGARYRFLRRLPSGTAANDVEVTEFVPDSPMTLASLSGPTPSTYRYSLSPHGKNTRLHLEGKISGDSLSPRLAVLAPFAQRFFERGMRANLATLKRRLENTNTGTSRVRWMQ